MPASKSKRVASTNENKGKRAAAVEEGSEEAFAEFLADARKLDARDIQPLRADAALAYHNVMIGVDAVVAEAGSLAKLPKPFNIKLVQSLPRLVLALLFAVRQVDRKVPSPGTTKQLLARAAELRKLLLTAAEALANSKLVPARLVNKIRKGKGMRDMVQDCIDLAALFRKYAAAVAGKTAITQDEIDEAATVGSTLIRVLVPKAARKSKKIPDELKNAVDIRDRLWTLVVTRHRDQVRRAGMWLWLDDVDDHVPPLQSRAAAARNPAKTAEPPPVG